MDKLEAALRMLAEDLTNIEEGDVGSKACRTLRKISSKITMALDGEDELTPEEIEAHIRYRVLSGRMCYKHNGDVCYYYDPVERFCKLLKMSTRGYKICGYND